MKAVDDGLKDKFVLHTRIVLREIPIFKKVCMMYHFKVPTTINGVTDTIIFVKQDCIFELNFEAEPDQRIKEIYKFNSPLNRQPLYFVPNSDQKIFMISSPEDCVYLNTSNPLKAIESNINEAFDILSVKNIIYDSEEKHYLVLCNKY